MPMKYFKKEEFECKCGCGGNNINPDLAEKLDIMREACGFPFIITSAFRCQTHNRAVGGHQYSAHCTGNAVDIAASGANALYIINSAIDNGITGIGVSQKGDGRFVHLDLSHDNLTFWSY